MHCAIIAVHVLVDKSWNEVRGEGDDEGLKKVNNMQVILRPNQNLIKPQKSTTGCLLNDTRMVNMVIHH